MDVPNYTETPWIWGDPWFCSFLGLVFSPLPVPRRLGRYHLQRAGVRVHVLPPVPFVHLVIPVSDSHVSPAGPFPQFSRNGHRMPQHNHRAVRPSTTAIPEAYPVAPERTSCHEVWTIIIPAARTRSGSSGREEQPIPSPGVLHSRSVRLGGSHWSCRRHSILLDGLQSATGELRTDSMHGKGWSLEC